MKGLILALIAVGSLSACKGFDVQQDPTTGVTHIVDADTGAEVGTLSLPENQTADDSGLAGAAGAAVGILTANPGLGAGAGLAVSWLLALLARRKPKTA